MRAEHLFENSLIGYFLCSPPPAIVVGGQPHVAQYVGKGHI